CNLNPDDPTMPSMFEPTHGSAPDIAGQGLADPTAMIFTAARMLAWLGRDNDSIRAAGDALYRAMADDLAENGNQRRDTRTIGDAVLARLKS
ncbi:MAG: isocitrate/isopropylmalate family dehydrogenase, partial [Marinobacter sp.]|nr:isocitrate/isopropylmalate family dehydrogenase [Marinobacter sp.]